jgi:hypothetical protein
MATIVETMESLPDLCPSSGASIADIKSAERHLGVSFAREYYDYLSRFGNASVNGHELTGISVSDRINVVSVTLAERIRNPNISKDLYVVEQTGIDRIVVWQDSKGAVFQTIPGCKPEKLCMSLSEYVSS